MSIKLNLSSVKAFQKSRRGYSQQDVHDALMAEGIGRETKLHGFIRGMMADNGRQVDDEKLNLLKVIRKTQTTDVWEGMLLKPSSDGDETTPLDLILCRPSVILVAALKDQPLKSLATIFMTYVAKDRTGFFYEGIEEDRAMFFINPFLETQKGCKMFRTMMKTIREKRPSYFRHLTDVFANAYPLQVKKTYEQKFEDAMLGARQHRRFIAGLHA